MKTLDIAPFALPNCAPGEIRFEEARDIVTVVIAFRGQAPKKLSLEYLRNYWPEVRPEELITADNTGFVGWTKMDDWFNCHWQQAACRLERISSRSVQITFRNLRREFDDLPEHYDVTFRRTLGLRVTGIDPQTVSGFKIYTTSTPVRSRLRIELDAGCSTPGQGLSCSGYNLRVRKIKPLQGMKLSGDRLQLGHSARRSFEIEVEHLRTIMPMTSDRGLLSIHLDHDTFTIAVDDLSKQQQIWYEKEGIFIALADDPTDAASHMAQITGKTTISQEVSQQQEQTFFGPFYGQPRPHPVAYNISCKHSRHRFRIEPCGDIVMERRDISWIKGRDSDRCLAAGNERFFFGLDQWHCLGRWPDTAPALIWNLHFRNGAIELHHRSVAVPLCGSILAGERNSDETVVALVQVVFTNTGADPAETCLPISYSQQSRRQFMDLLRIAGQSDSLIPCSPLEDLTVKGNAVYSRWHGKLAMRCLLEGAMRVKSHGQTVMVTRRLAPGESCELVIKIPRISPSTPAEFQQLQSLDVAHSFEEATQFWRQEAATGCHITTPIDHLNALHASHIAHVQVTDCTMPEEPELINTSVGTSTYGNFSNESCMICQELDQRGLHEEVRRRLAVWIKYQGTAPQPGNFTDYEGMYYGAGGYECGNYNQHHGWVLWMLAEHWSLTRDKKWLRSIQDSLLAGIGWVIRQRQTTMQPLPHSRGWEYGFLPAGSLEDVEDFWYWLSTNSLTWRGVDATVRALEDINHPQAAELRREADAYGNDLRTGFETMRQHSPLVRLRNGRWVPHYPSRLYCRGRDMGWIRETLEGSVYLLISGLYDANSHQAAWILDDFQDNRYIRPPFGYHIADCDRTFYNRGGLSMQPNLLAGLMPHLERDEPELYIWMFFNCWVSCYREEIQAMVEHPLPILGWSNPAHFKTSDQANAVMWLRYMFVSTHGDCLHLGRALPRNWLADPNGIALDRVVTHWGKVSVRYKPGRTDNVLLAQATIPPGPRQTLLRFRHPEGRALRSVKVNGLPGRIADANRGDVDLTGCRGRVLVEARFQARKALARKRQV